jgi:protein-L-isoaspartate(D-aspartate) O-methyltransferase
VNEPGEAYLDQAMKTIDGQTISQPSTVARMLLLADLKKGNDLLEVGSGSGWGAVLAALLVKPGIVHSIERIAKLKDVAELNLENLRKHSRDLFYRRAASGVVTFISDGS